MSRRGRPPFRGAAAVSLTSFPTRPLISGNPSRERRPSFSARRPPMTTTRTSRGTERKSVSYRLASGDVAIWVANADGSQAFRLTQEADRRPGSPRWSPDGRSIVYDSQLENGQSRIFIIDAAGGQPRRLTRTTDEDDEALPGWSRDGKSIYFRSVRSGRNEIWRAPADGGTPVQVTRSGGSAAYESWDGQTLYYSRGGRLRQLLSMPVAGGPERLVIDSVALWNYVPVETGIYYISQPSPDDRFAYELRFLDAATGQTRTVYKFESLGGLLPGAHGFGRRQDDRAQRHTDISQPGSHAHLITSADPIS